MGAALVGAAVLTAACAKKPVPLAPTPSANADSSARADSIARAEAARQAELARARAQQDT